MHVLHVVSMHTLILSHMSPMYVTYVCHICHPIRSYFALSTGEAEVLSNAQKISTDCDRDALGASMWLARDAKHPVWSK